MDALKKATISEAPLIGTRSPAGCDDSGVLSGTQRTQTVQQEVEGSERAKSESATGSGTLNDVLITDTRSGPADARLRLSHLVIGGAAQRLPEFAPARHRRTVGLGLAISAPTAGASNRRSVRRSSAGDGSTRSPDIRVPSPALASISTSDSWPISGCWQVVVPDRPDNRVSHDASPNAHRSETG